MTKTKPVEGGEDISIFYDTSLSSLYSLFYLLAVNYSIHRDSAQFDEYTSTTASPADILFRIR